MSKSIILKNTSKVGNDALLVLSGDTFCISGVQYRIGTTDAVKLLMFCEEVVNRQNQYMGLKEIKA